ncbi:uncharacterized protein PHACADRAFT_202777 [Phanerochaete carnosa HHB-10118-sp]|uniref:Uncharacterized protein n=1 Tax=Phanerochaete carnosa (strain HHB-10118-sp) TaxID=650164 RepID=K5VBK0_PHACS|nr:uncharacterized protein PHACADRAFT_202777 [Phanerochaete carnosa HHB-10118-sp]EKM48468.1 hypothetical protein PHACADRAFT_202777 [Phanerochaete carnosa HHB-10118-sp]
MSDYLVTVGGQANMLRHVRLIPVKGRGVIAWCLASTDPSDGLPSKVTDVEMIEKLSPNSIFAALPRWSLHDMYQTSTLPVLTPMFSANACALRQKLVDFGMLLFVHLRPSYLLAHNDSKLYHTSLQISVSYTRCFADPPAQGAPAALRRLRVTSGQAKL